MSVKSPFVPNKSEEQSRSLSCVGKCGSRCCQSQQSLRVSLKGAGTQINRSVSGCASTSLTNAQECSLSSSQTTCLGWHFHSAPFYFHLWAHLPLEGYSFIALGPLSPRNLSGSFSVHLLLFKPGHWEGNAGDNLGFILFRQTASSNSFLVSGWCSQCNCSKISI